jgi:hypothetical protein
MKSGGERPLGIPWHKWIVNVLFVMVWIGLNSLRIGPCESLKKLLGSVKCRKFFNEQSNLTTF